eukprot:74083_1
MGNKCLASSQSNPPKPKNIEWYLPSARTPPTTPITVSSTFNPFVIERTPISTSSSISSCSYSKTLLTTEDTHSITITRHERPITITRRKSSIPTINHCHVPIFEDIKSNEAIDEEESLDNDSNGILTPNTDSTLGQIFNEVMNCIEKDKYIKLTEEALLNHNIKTTIETMRKDYIEPEYSVSSLSDSFSDSTQSNGTLDKVKQALDEMDI